MSHGLTYLGWDYGSHARQAHELAEVRGLHEPCTDPNWVPPLLTMRAGAMDNSTRYPLDGEHR